ncbi:MAG: class I SAM-dependent methyltransferase [Acidobacteriaceae bacterium]|nr:class I SAM-dependent methyltransferase [Acidobacteriaceae bacterium]
MRNSVSAVTEWRRFSNDWPGVEALSPLNGITDRHAYHEFGRRSLQEVEAALKLAGRDLWSFTSILDFACGYGAMLMWLGELSKTTPLHGLDMDAAAARWAQHRIPYATISPMPKHPPVDYATDFFDLVICNSFCMHSDGSTVTRWLGELQRLTRPQGMLAVRMESSQSLSADLLSLRATLRCDSVPSDLFVFERVAGEVSASIDS